MKQFYKKIKINMLNFFHLGLLLQNLKKEKLIICIQLRN